MNLVTRQYRIKDSISRKELKQMASSVNFVWNYCNEVNQEIRHKFQRISSNYDLHKLTAGCGKDLGLHSNTIQAICDQYVNSCKQHKKFKLKWRRQDRSLGWIPFKSSCVKIVKDEISYLGHKFKIWLSRPILGKVRFGSFTQNSKGQWFINLIIEEEAKIRNKTGKACGIDLGLKTLITLSDGISFHRENLVRANQGKLSLAQKAKKKKRTSSIHKKIKNQRADWNNKISTLITTEYDEIFIGDVSPSKLIKTKMAKSVYNAGWSSFKQMLAYKAIALGSVYKEVKESYSTVMCSACQERSGPKGLLGLGVRKWQCSCCGSIHDRDVNAAKNIFRIGHDTLLKEA